MISITFLVSCFNALLAIVMLIYNWRLNKNILFFSLYLIIISFTSILYDQIINGGSAQLVMILIGNAGPLFFLMGPLFYFFIRGLAMEQKQFSDKDLLHFLPFFLNMIVMVPYMFESIEFKMQLAQNSLQNLSFYMNSKLAVFPIWISNTIRISAIVVYIVWSIVLLNRGYRKKKKRLKPEVLRYYLRNVFWLNTIAGFSLLFVLLHLGLTMYFRIDPQDMNLYENDNLFVLSTIVNILFPILILLNPGILFGLPTGRTLSPKVDVSEFKVDQGKKGETSKLKKPAYGDYFQELTQAIIAYYEQQQPYLDTDFNVHELAGKLNVPLHHIQFCMQNFMGKSFERYTNEFRVNKAKQLLSKALPEDLETMVNIRFESGFDTHAKFERAFKDITGYTLSQWVIEKI